MRGDLGRTLCALAATLAVASSPAMAASISFDRGPIVLGKTESVGVTIRVDEPEGEPERPLRLAVNVGSFGPVTRARAGQYRSIYIPPEARFPQVALVAVWRETGPDAEIEFLRVPLHGATRLPVKARRGSEVTVELGPERFGPVIVERSGQVQVPIAVPPELNQAVVVVKSPGGAITRANVPVAVPPYNRLTAGLVPHAVVADGESSARLHVYYDVAGAEPSPERIKVRPSLGEVIFEKGSRGRYVYRYVAPAGAPARRVSFDVTVDGDATARARAELALGLPSPARVIVRPPQEPLTADGQSRGAVSVLVLDSQGLGLVRQVVEISANGVGLPGVEEKGNGFYEAPYTAPASYPAGGVVQFAAGVAGSVVTGQANYQLRAPAAPKALSAQLEPPILVANGRSKAVVQMEVRDGAGQLLKGAQLFLVASHGTVTKVSELGGGRYESTYIPPAEVPAGEAVMRVMDSTGAFEHVIPVRIRPDPGRLLVGARGGLTHSLGDLIGPRGGLDVLAPLQLGGAFLAVGASVTVGHAAQDIAGEGTLRTRSEALFAPVALRGSYELLANRSFSLHVGAGALAAYAAFKTSYTQAETWQWGLGGLAFASGWLHLGPGHAFADLSISLAPVRTEDNLIELGGVGLEVGYRVAVF
jgi:hypothetical protein